MIRSRQDKWILTAWENKVVYDECILFAPDIHTRETAPCRLLFEPERILSVRSDYLNREYAEGIDYEVKDGCIVRLPGGSLPYFSFDESYPETPASIAVDSVFVPGRYVRFENAGIETHKRQIKVTYERRGGMPDFVRPILDDLPVTKRKLQNKEDMHILFYGDSFMAGCDASGASGIVPYMDTLDCLIVKSLAEFYDHPRIRFTNTAVGGTVSKWGLDCLNERVFQYNPDLVVIRFGMNDGSTGVEPEEFSETMRSIACEICKHNPDCEVIIMTSELPNPDCKGWTKEHDRYEAFLDAKIQDGNGVSKVRVMDFFKYICSVKGFSSITANFINHPNDFMIRLYANLVASSLGAVIKEQN